MITLLERLLCSLHTACNHIVLYLILFSQVEPLFAAAEKKNKLLRQTAGGGIEQMSEMLTEWDRFEVMMESHQLMIKERVCVSNGRKH